MANIQTSPETSQAPTSVNLNKDEKKAVVTFNGQPNVSPIQNDVAGTQTQKTQKTTENTAPKTGRRSNPIALATDAIIAGTIGICAWFTRYIKKHGWL